MAQTNQNQPTDAYALPVYAANERPMPSDITMGKWETGLCGCFSSCVPNCCMVSFCPCVSVAQITVRLGVASYCIGLIASIFLNWLWVWQLRSTTRKHFEIPGSCCGDCCASIFCSSCAVAQMATHVKSYEPGSCDFGPPDIIPGFQ